MAAIFSNPVMAGNNLARPSMQSPGFAPGADTGWSIAQDGSATFNNLTARGDVIATQFQGTDFVITTAGIFMYDGPI